MADERSPVEIELEMLIRARYPIIYIVSWEEKRVEETLRDICQRRGKTMLLWTFTTGMAGNVAQRDPMAALDYIMNAPDQTVFVLKDFHPFISDVGVTRRLRDLIYILKSSYKHIVILTPILKLPAELEKEITVVDYQLPTVPELDRLLEGVIQTVRADPRLNIELTPQEREQVLQAASGLTSIEAENVFAKSLVEKRQFDIDVILGEKEQIIRKSGILEYYRATEAFAEVGGLDLLKEWLRQRSASFGKEARDYGLPEPRGMLLLGVQGSGKSLTAKAIASLWKLPLLRLDIGKVFSGIVGSSEENMRRAIATAESVAPCVAGDTRITLADGSERTIEELYDNPPETLSVLGMTSGWKIASVGVRAVTRRPAPDLFTVRLRHGNLQATSNHLHPVLRNGHLEWVRTDALKTGDQIAMPRHFPSPEQMPETITFLPNETRLYATDAWEYLREEAKAPYRRHRAIRGRSYVKVSELRDANRYPAFRTVSRFVIGRGGTTDSTLTRLPEQFSPELGYLLGLIGSDGYLSKRNRIGFVNTDLELHERFAELLCKNFGLAAVQRQDEKVNVPSELPGTSEQSTFRPCYISYADNRLACQILRRVQERLLTLPASFLKAYLRGYFDGDGCISDCMDADPRVTLTAKRPAQNQLIRTVLQRIGFLPTNPGSSNIEITGFENVQRFISEIGSEHPYRRARMEAWRKQVLPAQPKNRCDLIPVGSLLRQARLSVGIASHRFASASSSLVNRYEHGQGHPNRERLKAIVSELQEYAATQGRTVPEIERLTSLVESPILWSPVVSITPEEAPEFVYDLVCDDPHNFIANGIVTHNCILWIDELEKGLSGTQSSGATDGGTTSRVFSTFLTWLSEKKAPVFVVATSNDVQQLPPELMRKGRFDEIFFVDLPAKSERQEIFSIHLKKRKRDPEKFDLEMLGEASAGYSGAEIEQAVVGALFSAFHDGMREVTTEDLHRTIKASVPLSITMREGIQRLREWAETRARQSSSEQSETMEQLANLEVARLFDAAEEAERQRKEIAALRAAESRAAEPPKAEPPKAETNGAGDSSEYKMEDEDEEDEEDDDAASGETAPITTNTPARPKRATKKEVKGDE